MVTAARFGLICRGMSTRVVRQRDADQGHVRPLGHDRAHSLVIDPQVAGAEGAGVGV
jgi:hypothetical protein